MSILIRNIKNHSFIFFYKTSDFSKKNMTNQVDHCEQIHLEVAAQR
jgi:hypothetical protein